ncbi:MAG TPA: protein kinase [Bryobacteraceae bacterium]|nr:protein kinase [Bryobacteraceae bacterium]
MPLSTGARFGLYEIVAPIGAGGMGEVYRARDTKLKRDVAVKVLPEAFARDPERMARFQREAEVLASLNHPNIATIFGVEENALVMELVEGESPKGPMPFDDAWKIASQIATALDYAHERGIVHRDLKPANIKVTPDGTVKLLDFGLAKAFSSGSDGNSSSGGSDHPSHSPTLTVHATEIGLILGTAAYMSPEQARGKKVDRRSDIFSFGVVLYELLTGERLFQGEDITDTLASVVKDQPDLTRVPVKARRLLERCLEKDPKKRLRDIGDAALLLEGAPVLQPAPQATSSRTTRLIWGAIAAAVILSAAIFIALRWRPSAPAASVRFEIVAPDNGIIEALALSPDGTKLALTVQGTDGRRGVWIRSLDTVEARQLAGTEGAGALAWSPDSRYIAFNAAGKLKKIDVSGGAPETICSYSPPFIGLSWNKQDVIVFSESYMLNRVSAAGGEPVQLTQLDPKRGDVGYGWPVFLPDQQHFLYYLAADPRFQGLYVRSLDEKPAQEDQRLTDSDSGPLFAPATGGTGYVVFLRTDTLMARLFDAGKLKFTADPVRVADSVGTTGRFDALATVSNTGVLAVASAGSTNRELIWYDRSGKVLSQPGEPAGRDELNLSPDGTQVAEGRVDSQGIWVVWLLDLARNASSRFTFDSNGAGNGVWSSDGKQIAFAAGGGSSSDIFRRPSNGATKAEVLFHSDGVKTPQDWSPDGHWLLYLQQSKDTHADLWVLPDPGGPLGEARKPVPYLATQFNELQGKFSPDGKWVSYTSNETGTNEIYVRPFPASSGGKWLVSNGGGTQARWRPDGKELFYVARDGTLMAVDVNTSSGFQAGVPKALFRTRISGGLGGAPGVAWRWDISKDGKRFLVNSSSEEKSSPPVTVTTDWTGMLRK